MLYASAQQYIRERMGIGVTYDSAWATGNDVSPFILVLRCKMNLWHVGRINSLVSASELGHFSQWYKQINNVIRSVFEYMWVPIVKNDEEKMMKEVTVVGLRQTRLQGYIKVWMQMHNDIRFRLRFPGVRETLRRGAPKVLDAKKKGPNRVDFCWK